jgi:hypothetical protein
MFDSLHQGRYWLDDQPEVDEVARACAALHVAAIAARELPKSMTWDPIVS